MVKSVNVTHKNKNKKTTLKEHHNKLVIMLQSKYPGEHSGKDEGNLTYMHE